MLLTKNNLFEMLGLFTSFQIILESSLEGEQWEKEGYFLFLKKKLNTPHPPSGGVAGWAGHSGPLWPDFCPEPVLPQPCRGS